jgi:pectate lyase
MHLRTPDAAPVVRRPLQPTAATGASGAAGLVVAAGSEAGGAGGGTAAVGGAGRPAEPTSMPGKGPAQMRAVGYGQATTGGGSTAARKVASLAELQSAIDAYGGSGGLVLEYTGHFDFAAISDPCTQHEKPAATLEIKEKSDITLLGSAGSGANFGVHIASDSHNIIIRNMTIGLTPATTT